VEPSPATFRHPVVDVVIVSYCSRETLRACVEPVAGHPSARVIVVDNASPDDSLQRIADIATVEAIRAPRNGGFSYGCNLGARQGSAPYILFLNPDARVELEAIDRLVQAAAADARAAVIAPRILDEHGNLAWSLRRFPRGRSTFAQALFLHRLWPAAGWSDELIRDPDAYTRARDAEWVSGACMLVRRSAFEAIGGFDEDFFLYCEDTDLCRRFWDAGLAVRFDPTAEVRHIGGASSNPGATQAIAASSRVIYARKHEGRRAARLHALGVGLGAATHAVAALTRPAVRRGHLAALRATLAGPATVRPSG
jgi:N-acetylglucosaminyl-diphospho-decaprenol L-rhamnosyltransferase